MPDTLTVLGIAGSLRAGSINRALLEAAQELAQDSMTIQIFDLTPIPMYNSELETDERRPAEVIAFKQAITRADGLLIVTPEYNYSVPGVLKNALDWASRPPDPPFVDKPVALMSASPGMLGGSRAQYHLRQICVYLDAHVLNLPEVFVGVANEKFDTKGELTDEKTREFVSKQLRALRDWTLRLRREGAAPSRGAKPSKESSSSSHARA